jgi:DNA invertase Pin-like site-specific DNA recombinase
MKVAVYLRVSTLDQANTSKTNRDGFSIPAQREACRRKAESLKAKIIKEYVDRGESARSADRPGLQRLLSDLCEKKNFDYVIVHKIDRLARNLHDDVIIGLAIQKGGAKLVSVTENIDETPSGRLLHGIMATIAEFYSRNLAAEALKGATEKAKQGGTPFQAPMGYLNITERINQREVHTIGLDSTRAPLVRWAFERYATGDYTQKEIRLELVKRGFRTRGKRGSKIAPISQSGVSQMLQNRYYLGYVSYCGIEYKGNHQPLVTPSTFAAVEAVRANRYIFERKYRKHIHYLSRMLICGQCGRHLCYEVTKRGKRSFDYFVCINRRFNGCTQPYIPARLAEEAVITTLEKLVLSDDDRTKLTREVSNQLNSEKRYTENEIAQQKQRQNRLLAEQENLLQAYYDKVVQPALFKREQKRINNDIDQAMSVITDAESRLAIIIARREKALDLMKDLDIGKVLIRANKVVKRLLCQALFQELAIDDKATIQSLPWLPRAHQVNTTSVKWYDPIKIKHITDVVLSLSPDEES